jgi:hypothetical protein
VNEAARQLNLGHNEAHRAVTIAGMTPEAKAAAKEAGLDDNQKALTEIAKAPATEQVAVAKKIAKRPAEPKPRKKKAAAATVQTEAPPVVEPKPVVVDDGAPIAGPAPAIGGDVENADVIVGAGERLPLDVPEFRMRLIKNELENIEAAGQQPDRHPVYQSWLREVHIALENELITCGVVPVNDRWRKDQTTSEWRAANIRKVHGRADGEQRGE